MTHTEFDYAFDDDPDAQYDVNAVRPIDQWLEEYAEHHQHPTNVKIHCFSIPALFAGVFGLLWAIPMPSIVSEYGTWLNVGSAVAIVLLIHYVRVSWPLAIGLLVGGVALLLFVESLQRFFPSVLWQTSLVLICGAWIAQSIGQRMETSQMSVRESLWFLLMGPLWMVANAYRIAQIPY